MPDPCWLSLAGCLVLAVSRCLSRSACPTLAFQCHVPRWLSPVLVFLSRMSCPALAVLSCPVLAAMHWLSCPGCHALTIMRWLSCPSCYILAVQLWPSWPGYPDLAILTWLIWPGFPDLAFPIWLSRSGFPHLAVLCSPFSCSSDQCWIHMSLTNKEQSILNHNLETKSSQDL